MSAAVGLDASAAATASALAADVATVCVRVFVESTVTVQLSPALAGPASAILRVVAAVTDELPSALIETAVVNAAAADAGRRQPLGAVGVGLTQDEERRAGEVGDADRRRRRRPTTRAGRLRS